MKYSFPCLFVLVFPYEAFVLNHPSVSLPFSFIVCTCDLFVSNVFFPCLESCFAVVFQRRIKFINILLSKTLHTYFCNEVLYQYLIIFRFTDFSIHCILKFVFIMILIQTFVHLHHIINSMMIV